MNLMKPLLSFLATMPLLSLDAGLVAHFPMDVVSGQIEERISGDRFDVEGNFSPENVYGAVGNALRFDGYTSRVEARLGDIIAAGSRQMTVSVWVAVPCYPVIQIDTETSEKTPVVTCLDKDNKTGFGFYIGFDGRYSFSTYIGGWPVDIEVSTPLPAYQWNNLVAVVDCDSRYVKLYNNGVEVGSGKANGSVSFAAGPLYMGQGIESRMAGPFELMSFNGLIDDISVWDEAKSQDEIKQWQPENAPDFDIPSSRFAEDMLRPRFHAMPAAGWTNECHGMFYSDGRYHLFFQKNGNGPYMARLHWGHLSSENLYDWREEKIAIAPGETYDMKGCWSGCVFADDVVTGGEPNILYTAVDYAKAAIARAVPESEDLAEWKKVASNPIIGGRPGGLSDDFRDPYFFRNGENAYIIVGSSKNGIGTTTLHRYDLVTGMWTNSGDLFFTGSSAAADGTFWEMPTVTRMPDGRWLFTATPQNTAQGVRTLYWTGTVDADGHFVPDSGSSGPRLVEMDSRDGFGLLSPTVYCHNGKVIALGIVPDKLPSSTNWKLGWAHCYSLPREWSLADDGSLLQKPYDGLAGLRGNISFSRAGFTLDGELSLLPVRGRSVEICGKFEVGTSDFGFRLFEGGSAGTVVTYSPATGELTVDFSSMPRLSNDANVYDGIYRYLLPDRPAIGSEMKMNIFVDHSIIDIFVNDRWAVSIRVFPTGADADGVDAFSESPVKVNDLKAWVLEPGDGDSAVDYVWEDCRNRGSGCVDVFNMQGIKVRSGIPADAAADNLPAGLYIVGGRKIMVR